MHTSCMMAPDQFSNSIIVNQIVTCAAFLSCFSILPSLILCYFCVQFFRKVWLKILSNRFPYFNFVETTSIRTLLDNHRNQGIFNVLMTIKGTCQPMLIQQALVDRLLDKKDRRGHLQFPKLRAGLFSCWGNYAWRSHIPFVLENHFIVGKPTFRGRPLTDHNVQEYVNEIVGKYLPSNMPPWQIVVIPNIASNEEKYCILIRVHHLLIADDEPLSVGDFLLVRPEIDQDLPLDCSLSSKDSSVSDLAAKSSFTNIIEPPRAIPKLYSMICDSVSNRWNEFIYECDPIESPKLMKSKLGIFHCIAIITIAIVSIYKEYSKSHYLNVNEPGFHIKYFINGFLRETSRRGLTITVVFRALWTSLNPLQMLINFFQLLWWINSLMFITIPMIFYREALTIFTIQTYGIYQSSFVSFFLNYLPLMYSASMEVINILIIVYTGPIKLIRFFFSNNKYERHHFQSVSLCGRKSIAWSHPINRKGITDAACALGVSETAILLTITSNCVKEYFCHAGLKMPKSVLLTAKTVSSDSLLASSIEQHRKKIKDTGILCFPMPIGKGEHKHLKNEAVEMNNLVTGIKNEQRALFTLSKKHALIVQVLPSVMARILLNYWSRKFSVALTEISDSTDGNYLDTLWGHRVLSLLFWKPPQGNISMSITLQRYVDSVRIGIMADSQLAPHHMAISRYWAKVGRRLIHQSQSLHY